MFNMTAFFDSTPEGGNQAMLVLGMLMTSLVGMASNIGRSLLDNLYRIFFFRFNLDESHVDSPNFEINEGVYKMILENRSRLLQGWSARLARSDFCEPGKEIKGHQFSITTGGIYFWIGWQFYYAEYEMKGNRWWPQNKMDIYGFRWSSWKLIEFLDQLSRDKNRCIKWTWRCSRDRDGEKWSPGIGRDRDISILYYLPTPDSEAVIREVERYYQTRQNENLHPLIKQTNVAKFLLYGPPGTGKTDLVKWIAFQKKAPLYVITQEVLDSSNFSKMIQTLPDDVVLLFDDIDMDILKEKDDPPEKERGREGSNLKAVIKSVMEGTVTLPAGCLYFITCNNTELDQEITSRFTPFYIGHAKNDWRKRLFSELFEGKTHKLLDKLEKKDISQRTFTRALAQSYVPNNPGKTASKLVKKFSDK